MLDKIADNIADLILKVGRSGIKEPTFVKPFEKNEQLITDLTELAKSVSDNNRKKQIEQDIVFLEQGMQGEANVAFELENSLIPMVCLHDVRIEYENYAAQMDFIIITRNCVIVLETKKLVGDIEITRDGHFNRIFKNRFGKVIRKEGMYSPVSQNERQVRILEKMLKEHKLIRNFTPVKSLVILANPRTIIHKRYAPKSVQKNIYKYDQITKIINKENKNNPRNSNFTDKKMFEIAKFIMKYEVPKSFMEKYKDDIEETEQNKVDSDIKKEQSTEKNTLSLDDMLRNYRTEVSTQESVPAYFIFSNAEMEDIMKHKPKSHEELLEIKGFGKVKVEKYGDRIIEIIKMFK